MNENLTRSDSNVSSIRYAMLKILQLIQLSVFVMLTIFVYQAAKGITIDWIGAAAFIGGLGVLLTGIAGSKAYQKSNEK
jgi:hypothetical protein